MAPKKESVKRVSEAPPPEPEKSLQPEPKNGDQWFHDPIEREAAIRLAMTLQQKIDEKAQPIRTWLEENIVGLLLQALSALVAHRPSNPHEFLAAYLIKNNPLKATFPEDEIQPKNALEKENIGEYDPCGCTRFKNKGSPPPPKEAPAADPIAKKPSIVADAAKVSVASNAARASVLAKAKAGSAKK